MKSSAIGGLAVFTTLACAMIGYVPRANAAPAPAVSVHAANSAPAVTGIVFGAR